MKRVERLNELIKKEIGKIIFNEMEVPPGSLVTITKVEVAGDLSQAKIYLSIFPDNLAPDLLKKINRRSKYFKKILSSRLIIREMPKIEFFLDKTEAEAAKIEEIFKSDTPS